MRRPEHGLSWAPVGAETGGGEVEGLGIEGVELQGAADFGLDVERGLGGFRDGFVDDPFDGLAIGEGDAGQGEDGHDERSQADQAAARMRPCADRRSER